MNNTIISKKIVNDYFEIISPILYFDETVELDYFNDQVLKILLDIYNVSNDYELYKSMIHETKCIKTIKDANVFRGDEIKDINIKTCLEVKANALKKNQIERLSNFDFSNLENYIYKESFKGNADFLKYFGFMKYLGFGTSQNTDVAKNIFNMLSISGDVFAIKAMIYLAKQTNNSDDELFYEKVFSIYSKVKDEFLFNYKVNTKESSFVQIILCYNYRKVKNDESRLDIPLLTYAINNLDNVKEVLNNICNLANNGYILLLHSSYFNNKSFNF